MVKMTHLIAAILLASVSVAYAETSGQPVQPASQGAASVEKNLDANKSGGKADKGLTTAEKSITAKHKNSKEGKAEKAMMEKAEHAEIPERPGR
jgi:hypothetical protein